MTSIQVNDTCWAIYLRQNKKPDDLSLYIAIAPVKVLYIEPDGTCLCMTQVERGHSTLGPMRFCPDNLFKTGTEAMMHLLSAVTNGVRGIDKYWKEIRASGGDPEAMTDHLMVIDLDNTTEYNEDTNNG